MIHSVFNMLYLAINCYRSIAHWQMIHNSCVFDLHKQGQGHTKVTVIKMSSNLTLVSAIVVRRCLLSSDYFIGYISSVLNKFYLYP